METFIMFKNLIGKNVYPFDWVIMNMMQNKWVQREQLWLCSGTRGLLGNSSHEAAASLPCLCLLLWCTELLKNWLWSSGFVAWFRALGVHQKLSRDKNWRWHQPEDPDFGGNCRCRKILSVSCNNSVYSGEDELHVLHMTSNQGLLYGVVCPGMISVVLQERIKKSF